LVGNGTVVSPSAQGPTTIFSVAVPMGAYTVSATFDAENDNGSPVTGSCDPGTGAAVNFTIPPHSILPVTLTQPWQEGYVPPIPLRCLAFGGDYRVSNGALTATAVGSLHLSFVTGSGA
jgi:hypothetical protein